MSTLLFPELIGGKNYHTYCTVPSPGLFLQGQEGYQTSRYNNAGTVKITKIKLFQFANIISSRIRYQCQVYYMHLCIKGKISLKVEKLWKSNVTLVVICACRASLPSTKANSPRPRHTHIYKHTQTHKHLVQPWSSKIGPGVTTHVS